MNQELSPQNFHKLIVNTRAYPEYLSAHGSLEAKSAQTRQAIVSSAIKFGLREIAQNNRTNPESEPIPSPMAAAYSIAAKSGDFFAAQQKLDTLRMSRERLDRSEFLAARNEVIDFNHTLHDALDVIGNRYNFHELLTFLDQSYATTSGGRGNKLFHERMKEAIVGMRNELAVEQVLISEGIEYQLGTLEEDAKGGDFIISGVPVDVKSSFFSAEKAKREASRHGRNPDTIIWSQIDFEDFEGRLSLPYEKVAAVGKKLLPKIERAVSSAHVVSKVV